MMLCVQYYVLITSCQNIATQYSRIREEAITLLLYHIRPHMGVANISYHGLKPANKVFTIKPDSETVHWPYILYSSINECWRCRTIRFSHSVCVFNHIACLLPPKDHPGQALKTTWPCLPWLYTRQTLLVAANRDPDFDLHSPVFLPCISSSSYLPCPL